MSLPLFLSIGSASAIGVADYLGGIAARKAPAIPFVAAAQTVNLAILSCAALFGASAVTPRDLWFGAAAGIAGSLAFGTFLVALAAGPMSVVSPVAAVLGAGSGFGIGMALGESPSRLALIGCLTGLIAIALVAREGRGATRIAPRVLGLAIGAGIGFGGFVVFLDRPSEAAGMWPLVAARAAGVAALLLVTRLQRAPLRLAPGSSSLILSVGVLESIAIIALQAALHAGSLTIVAVVSSLYPVSTILLARIRLGERLERHQVAGVGLALGSVALIAAG